MGQLRLAGQILKKRPKMNHCLAQVLGRGVSKPLANRDFVSVAIVVDHHRMVHQNICRPLLLHGQSRREIERLSVIDFANLSKSEQSWESKSTASTVVKILLHMAILSSSVAHNDCPGFLQRIGQTIDVHDRDQ